VRRVDFSVLLLAGALGLSATAARALSVSLKNMVDDSPAPGLGFGTIDAAAQDYHTSRQYVEIVHPASRFRKIYFYTDNGGAFGIPEEGMVNLAVPAQAGVPFYFRAFPGHPDSLFAISAEPLWTPILEKSRPEYSDPGVKDARALVAPAGPDGRSRVAVGLKTSAGVSGGVYAARLVLEEFSDVPDITGPAIGPQPFRDLILLDIPMGIPIPLEDDGTVASSTFYFRLDGAGPFAARPSVVTPNLANPFAATVETQILPADLHPGTMEYYFSAMDSFDNETVSPTFQANLVTEDGTVSRPMTTAGGTFKVAVGDPSIPGFEVQFPPNSLNADKTIELTLKPSGNYPDLEGQPVVRAFDIGPQGLRFSRPVTIVLPYADQDQDGKVDFTGIDELQLKVFWWDGILWRFVGGQVDPVANQVRAQVSHFSVYGLAPLAIALTPDMVRPAEKIITPNGDGQNDFAQFNISPPFEVEIFDTRGSRVRGFSDVNIWDGRNDDGTLVETGTYVYRLTGQGLTVTGTFAVAR